MRKIISLGIVLTIFIYLLPISIQYISNSSDNNFMQDMLSVHANAQIEDEQTITVSVDGKAEEINLEDYIAGVVASEISPDFPVEAIKAQAVAARTYAVYKIEAGRSDTHPDADVCDDFHHCAAYKPLAEKYNTKYSLVERDIRYAIEHSDFNGCKNYECLYKMVLELTYE